MRYTLTIREEHQRQLEDAIFSIPNCEGAAYLLCGVSATDDEIRLLVRDIVPVAAEHYLVREWDRLSIDSSSYAAIAKRARITQAAIVFVHSHPGGFADFSTQDNREEPKLLNFLTTQVPETPHGSLVIASKSRLRGRVWTAQGWKNIERVRVLGSRFHFVDNRVDEEQIPEFFARQVRAFGSDIQRLLKTLHIGVVGAGGTGSAVTEQLVRLGVGAVSTFDGDSFEESNVSRVYGSRASDDGKNKAEISSGHILEIGLGTQVNHHNKHINDESTAKHLRECDVVFSCVDKHAPRGVLVRLALRYLIPVFDTAIKIDSEEGMIRGIYGRVTTILPGEACLFCRERISSRIIALESLSPEEWQALADEEYAPQLETENPAVITFTTFVAAQAVAEFLHRLTGYMGKDRQSSEVLMLFHENTIRTNRTAPDPNCMCMQSDLWGQGDSRDFLGLVWPEAIEG